MMSAGMTQSVSLYGEGLFATSNTIGARFQNATVAALIGGTTSVITGGSFVDGAILGVYSRLFNDQMQSSIKDAIEKEVNSLMHTDEVTELNKKEEIKNTEVENKKIENLSQEIEDLEAAKVKKILKYIEQNYDEKYNCTFKLGSKAIIADLLNYYSGDKNVLNYINNNASNSIVSAIGHIAELTGFLQIMGVEMVAIGSIGAVLEAPAVVVALVVAPYVLKYNYSYKLCNESLNLKGL